MKTIRILSAIVILLGVATLAWAPPLDTGWCAENRSGLEACVQCVTDITGDGFWFPDEAEEAAIKCLQANCTWDAEDGHLVCRP